MKTVQDINPGQEGTRAVLRVIGPATAATGLVLFAVGVISFFSSFGTFAPPRYFWCAILGIPILGGGLALTKMAYLGSIFRYFAGEVAPVQKDTFNYLAHGTSEGVETLAHAVGHGFATGMEGSSGGAEVSCPKCQAPNPNAAHYCSRCGTALGPRTCRACGKRSDPEARFCHHCGDRLD